MAHERLVSALESFQDAFALYDASDRLVLCNSAFRNLLPTHWSSPAVGSTFEALLDGEIAGLVAAVRNEVQQVEGVDSVDVTATVPTQGGDGVLTLTVLVTLVDLDTPFTMVFVLSADTIPRIYLPA